MKTKLHVAGGLIGLLWALPLLLLAQTVRIEGVVLDAASDEPIPFANVFLPEQPERGVAADFSGVFVLELEQVPRRISVSALGYTTLEFDYVPTDQLRIKLEPAAAELAEVVVTVDKDYEDPAYPIMRQVVARKPQNDHRRRARYQCEVYNKMEIDFINITDEFKALAFNQPFQFVFERMDSTSEDEPFLPVLISETLSDYTYQRDPKREAERIQAAKIVGDEDNDSATRLLGIAKQTVNVYDDWMDLILKSFVSPAADQGENFYRYYLVDSAYIEGRKCFQIQFFPKHKGINAFTGDLWINDTTYAVKRAKLQILGEQQLNFVERLTIVQDFQLLSSGRWMPQRDYIRLVSTTITEPFLPKFMKRMREIAPGLQAKRSTYYSAFEFPEQVPDLDNEVIVGENAFVRDDEFWEATRPVPLSSAERSAYSLVDTVRTLPVVQTYKKILTLLGTGYAWGDYVEPGELYSIYANNPIEGSRVRLALRTSDDLHPKLLLGIYGAYGFGDQKFKYGVDGLYVFNRSPRRAAGASYLNDYFTNPNFSHTFSIVDNGYESSFFFRDQSIPFKLLSVEHLSAYYFHDFGFGLSANAKLLRENYRPLFNFAFKLPGENPQNSYRNAAAELTLRFAYKETWVAGVYERRSLGSRFPVVQLRYTYGLPDLLGGDLDYQSLEVELSDKIRLGILGYTNAGISVGKFWGRLPYLNMFVPAGNEGIFYNDVRGFNTISEYVFATDAYVYANFDHHFDGLLLGWIKPLRAAKVRTVANVRGLYGTMTAENRTANRGNLAEHTTPDDAVRIYVPDQQPFVETSVGVENIFRFLRLDAVWRLTYRDLDRRSFGVRISAAFQL